MHVPQRARAPQSPWVFAMMARVAGHQRRPSLFMPSAAFTPIRPIGVRAR
ncbi:hypothetical protein M2160_000038 [Streptomyces sp. SAI-117]|nr:hypothetical protein [Streptomyces sp. SAI-117]MDH6565017.1 hypothetical protein [Streptomyces sp. SAI-117]